MKLLTFDDTETRLHMTEDGIYKVTVRIDPLLAVMLEAFDEVEPLKEDTDATRS